MEWLFATDDGREELQRISGFERLLVVLLHREHEYASLDSVKAELSAKVLELAPPNVGTQVGGNQDCNHLKTRQCVKIRLSNNCIESILYILCSNYLKQPSFPSFFINFQSFSTSGHVHRLNTDRRLDAYAGHFLLDST